MTISQDSIYYETDGHVTDDVTCRKWRLFKERNPRSAHTSSPTGLYDNHFTLVSNFYVVWREISCLYSQVAQVHRAHKKLAGVILESLHVNFIFHSTMHNFIFAFLLLLLCPHPLKKWQVDIKDWSLSSDYLSGHLPCLHFEVSRSKFKVKLNTLQSQNALKFKGG